MKNKALFWLFITVLVIPTPILLNLRTVHSCSEWMLYVDPPVIGKEITAVGQEFSVNIRVACVEFLYGWQFKLTWDPDLLNATSFTEGPFLKGVGNTYIGPQNPINNQLGVIQAFGTLLHVGDFDAPSGNGTIAIITFLVKAEGECLLRLSSAALAHRTDPQKPGQSVDVIPKVEHGYYKFPLSLVYVEPAKLVDSTLEPGSSFAINVSISRVTNLTSWQFFLEWDPSLLNATGVTEGNFLNQNGIYETLFLQPEINQTTGYLLANCSTVNLDHAATGNGILATITFLVEAKGNTYLILPSDKSKLVNNEGVTIPHATDHSQFSNALPDLAVRNVQASSNTAKAGDSVRIEVTVVNEGVTNETSIDVSVTTPSPPSPSYIIIGTKIISRLDVNQETTLNFTWNTNNVGEGEYTIMAQVGAVSGELDTEDNVGYLDAAINITSPEELPTTLIIGAIVAVAAIGLGLFLYRRRKSPRI